MEIPGFADVTEVLRSGVYLLCKGGKVIYVGKSKAVIGRVNAHRRAWADRRKGTSWVSEVLGIPGLFFDEVHVRPCPVHQLDRLEREMIDRFRPKYNEQLRRTGPILAPIEIVIAGQVLTLNKPPELCLRR